MLRLGRDDVGASPLTVILVAVLVAGGITALVVMSLVGGVHDALALQQVDDHGVPAFQVTSVAGGVDWDHLSVQLVDPAGVDQAGIYLQAPNGTVTLGDVIHLRTLPPGGTYLLRILQDGTELTRLAVAF
ncbi:MAG: hypothetical protein V4510_00230 [bacterium]